MSIFKKVTTLFLISLVLMFYVSNFTDKVTNEKIELTHKSKYIQASQELFKPLVNGDLALLQKQAKEFGYSMKKSPMNIPNKTVIYEKNISFGKVLVYKQKSAYFLYMKYLDDSFVFYDNSQKKELEKKETLNYLILADLLILIVIFILLIRMLSPLKNLSIAMEKFGKGDYSWRLPSSKKNDEIARLINQFNEMATNLESLILSRTQLLNDISHELKTPISKSLLSLEMLEEGKYKKILKKSISQIDNLTNELLDIEKFNSKHLHLDMQIYSIDTILFEAISKMLIGDEKELDVEIGELFTCKADLNYMAIAVKNLIDNAIKYKTSQKVQIHIDKNFLEVKNRGDALTRELDYYLETFTQEDSSRNVKGYGLGLNLVKRILDFHNFKLTYRYEDGYNIFSIIV